MRTPFPHNKEEPQLEGRPRSGNAGHSGADVIDVSHTGAGLTGPPPLLGAVCLRQRGGESRVLIGRLFKYIPVNENWPPPRRASQVVAFFLLMPLFPLKDPHQ